MSDGRSKYVLFLIALIAGAGLTVAHRSGHGILADHSPCLFRNITTLPCPSCGTTRAMVMLIDGNIAGAAITNPLAILALGLLIVGAFSALRDAITGSRDFPQLWVAAEKILRRKSVFLPLTGLLLVNWCWNIIKGV